MTELAHAYAVAIGALNILIMIAVSIWPRPRD